MKRLIGTIAFVWVCVGWVSATTYYVNPTTGGTRYSATNTSGQCNGQSAAAYVSGVNQPCSYKDFRLLWNDPTVGGVTAWVIAGGDTVLISGYESSPGTIAGPGGGLCPGVDPCVMPSIPSGSSGSPTRILGANYASCGTNIIGGDLTKEENLLAIGTTTAFAIAVNASQYVDVECLNVNGEGDAIFGIFTGNSGNPRTAANVTLKNLNIQGFKSAGIFGPIAGLFSLTDVRLYMNANAGWNFDDGSQDYSTGSVVGSFFAADWSGCHQEWPITHAIPVNDCRDDLHAGYGDGIGTPSTALDFSCDHCRGSYNTQDGFDLLHSLTGHLSITNSHFEANMGANIKLGPSATITSYNNTIVANCYRMSAPITGAQTGYNNNLSDFCRAAGDQNLWGWVTNSLYLGNAYAVGTAITGTDTHFTTQVVAGNVVAPSDFPFSTYGGRTVVSVTDDTHLVVSGAYPTNWGSSGSPLHVLYVPGGTPSSSSTVTMYHNSDVGYGATVFDGGCYFGLLAPTGFAGAPADSSFCAGGVFTFKDNLIVGIIDTNCTGSGCSGGTVSPQMWAGELPTVADYNLYYNLKTNPCVGAHDTCTTNPLFVSQPSLTIAAESELDNYNFNLTGASGAIAAGVNIGGQTVDQAGINWAAPPSLGAFQYVSGSPGGIVGGIVVLKGVGTVQ